MFLVTFHWGAVADCHVFFPAGLHKHLKLVWLFWWTPPVIKGYWSQCVSDCQQQETNQIKLKDFRLKMHFRGPDLKLSSWLVFWVTTYFNEDRHWSYNCFGEICVFYLFLYLKCVRLVHKQFLFGFLCQNPPYEDFWQCVLLYNLGELISGEGLRSFT